MKKVLLLLLFAITTLFKLSRGGILQARPSETREVLSLDGLWYFTTNGSFADNVEDANDLDVNVMPVPSSYNDIFTKLTLRDHVGSVWYQKKFYAPSEWSDQKIWIRFGSVCYNASVTINGQLVVTHQIGHLPFLAEISSAVNFGKENTIIVEVNNILSPVTIPQGKVDRFINGRQRLHYDYDFFHYAGIDRPVVIYTTSRTAFVDDLDIHTHVNGTSGFVTYNLTIVGKENSIKQQVNIVDKKGNIVASSTTQDAVETITVENANLWWPYLMDPNPGYMYTLEVMITQNDILVDHYKQPFGIRQLHFDNDTFTINGKNIYIQGFGRHEDSDFRGKGVDFPLILRDHNLIKWVGANCYRTSHYPYAEEIMDITDELGIMIIDEVPAVNTGQYSEELLKNHKQAVTELYLRDKNRPSVVVWSMANEPQTNLPESEDYYRQVVAHIKSFDGSRPVTIVNNNKYMTEHSGQFLDILAFNYYSSWGDNLGDVDAIHKIIPTQARGWRTKHNKPVILSEYGAASLSGLSMLPVAAWSEEYHLDVMEQHFKIFDELRSEGWFIGEMIWNFADFKTDERVKKVGGNRKGIFTRDRQPKAAAFLLRKRYWALAEKLYNVTLPNDLDKYIVKSNLLRVEHDEL